MFERHGTKIFGYLTAFVAALATLLTTGAFDGLLTPEAIRWGNIGTSLLLMTFGGATVVKGHTNTTAERVADAMKTAIHSTPPEKV